MYWLVNVMLLTMAAMTTCSSVLEGLLPTTVDIQLPSQPPDNNHQMELFKQRLSSTMSRQLEALRAAMASSGSSRAHKPTQTAPERTTPSKPKTAGAGARLKREYQHHTNPFTDDKGIGLLNGDDSLHEAWKLETATGAQHVHVFSDDGDVYALAAFGRNTSQAALLQLQDNSWSRRHLFKSLGTLHFTSFLVNGSRYIIGAESECARNRMDKRGPILYHFYRGILQYRHALPKKYPTDVEIWRHHEDTYIGVASFLGKSSANRVEQADQNGLLPEYNSLTHHTTSSVFKWTDGNFEEIRFDATGPRDIEHFSIHSHRYLAVVNFVDDHDNYNIYSLILRYNLATGKYDTFQRFRTNGAVRIRHFYWGEGAQEEHFLVVANQLRKGIDDKHVNYHVNSIIYKFHGNQFLPFQCIATFRAQDVLTVWGVDFTEFALFFLDAEGLKVYQYTGWLFILVNSIPNSSADPLQRSISSSANLATFKLHGHTYLTVGASVYGDLIPTIYKLNFIKQRTVDDLHDRLGRACSRTGSELRVLESRIDDLTKRVHQEPKINEDITLKSLLIHGSDNTLLKHVTTNNVILESGITLNASLFDNVADLATRVNFSLARLLEIRDRLNQAVLLSDNHTFLGEVNFHGPVALDTVRINHLNATRLNSRPNITNFVEKVVYLDKTLQIQKQLNFNNVLVGSKIEAGSLNNIVPSTLLKRTGNDTITGTFVINGSTAAASVNAATVNDRPINPDSVIVQGKLPAGIVNFGAIRAEHVSCGRLNSLDLSEILLNTVHVNSTTFPACSFDSTLSIGHFETSELNGQSLRQLGQFGLRQTGSQLVTAGWSFERLSTDSLILSGSLNGAKVPGDLIPINDPSRNYTVSSLVFSGGDPHIHELHVEKQLGTISVRDGVLQVLLLTSDTTQIVSGDKIIERLHVGRQMSTSDHVNNLIISSDMGRTIIERNLSYLSGDIVVAGNVSFLGDSIVGGLFNNVNVAQFLSELLPINQTEQLAINCAGNITFVGGVDVNVINDISPVDWLRTDIASQQVSGSVFLNNLTIDGSVSFGLLDGIDVDHLLENVLKIDGSQTVTGPLRFTDTLSIESAYSDIITWSGNNFTNVVTTTESHTITSEKTYVRDLTVSGVNASSLRTGGLIDGVNVTQLLEEARNHTSTIFSAAGVHTFTQSVTAAELDVQQADEASGNQLVQLIKAAGLQQLVSDFVFVGPVSVDNLVFKANLDGVSSSVFGSDWLTSSANHVFSSTASLVSTTNLSAASVQTSPDSTINHQTAVSLFDSFILLPDSGDVIINNNLHIDELNIQSLHSEQLEAVIPSAVRTDSINVFPHQTNFTGSVSVLQLEAASVNRVDIADLCNDTRLRTHTQFDSLSIHGNVYVNSLDSFNTLNLNGYDLNSLEDRYLLKDANQTVRAAVTIATASFKHITNQELRVGDDSSSINLMSLLENYWSKSGDQVVNGEIIINGDLIVDHLIAHNLNASRLNGAEIERLFSDSLTSEGCVIRADWSLASLLVTGNLSTPTLNGFDPVLLVKTSAEQALIFDSNVVIGNLYVEGNLSLADSGTYEGYDLSDVFSPEKYLMKNGIFIISSNVVFNGNVTFTKPLYSGSTVNNMVLSDENLLTRHGNQQIDTSVMLVSRDPDRCVIADIIAASVTNVHLDGVINYAVRINRQYNITGNWTFANNPNIEHIRPYDSNILSSITELRNDARSTLAALQRYNSDEGGRYISSLRSYYHQLLSAFSSTPRYLQYFQLTQRMSFELTRLIPVTVAEEQPPILLAVSPSSVRLLHWNFASNNGLWSKGAKYPDLSDVSSAAALNIPIGGVFVAVSRLVSPSKFDSNNYTDHFVHKWTLERHRQTGEVNYIYRFYRGQLNQFQYLPAYKSVDVKAVTVSMGRQCFLFVNYLSAKSPIVCYSQRIKRFKLHQILTTDLAREASVFSMSGSDGDQCIAVTGSAAVDVWCWNSTQDRFLLFQHLPSTLPLSINTAVFHQRIVMAIVHSATDKLPALLDIYSYSANSSQFVHMQTLSSTMQSGGGAITVRLLVLSSDQLLLVALTRLGRVVYWTYEGHSWFQAAGELTVHGASFLAAYNVPPSGSQLAVAGKQHNSMLLKDKSQLSVVYSATFMGQHLF